MQALKISEKVSETSNQCSLISDLLEMLDEEGVQYCHWKSNWRIDKWLKGEGDLDLLIKRSDINRFTSVLSKLDFKRAIPPKSNELPAVLNFYGYDPKTQEFVNVHAHYQLVFGHELTNNYRFPIEETFIAKAYRHEKIFVASPEMDLIFFVMRKVLKNSKLESRLRFLIGNGEESDKKIFGELAYLESRIDSKKLDSTLKEHFPMLDKTFFDECLESLRKNGSIWQKIKVKSKMKKALSSYTRTNEAFEILTRSKRGISLLLRKILRMKLPQKKFEGGGMVLAFVGGDGAGKTTTVNNIFNWLSQKFEVRNVHLGKPPKSFSTLIVGAALKVQKKLFGTGDKFNNEPNFLQNLRWLCTARDRHKLYKKIRRYAANGEIVICDRYPIPNLKLMDAPRIPVDSGQFLAKMENQFYREILPADKLFGLLVEPQTAVERKVDEPAEHVLSRSTELWNFDWQGAKVHLIDANRPLEEMLADLRKEVWASL